MVAVAKKYFFLLTALCIVLLLPAQTYYSNDPNYIKSKSEIQNNSLTDFFAAYPDTTITDLHNKIPRNFLGNLSLPQPNYHLKYKSSPLGFNLYPLPFSADVITPNQVNYYRTKGPFASLTGIAGSKQLQYFDLLFSHTLKNNLNISLKLNRYGSQGFYLKQQSFTNNFYLSLNYKTNNNRFGFYAYALLNKIKHQENGGLRYDTLIEQFPLVNKQLFPIFISDARRNIQQLNTNFNPWIKLTGNDDSSGVSHIIDYKFNFNSSYYLYSDAGLYKDMFYLNSFIDTLKTHDSTHLAQFKNTINYTIKFNKLGLKASFGYTNEYTILNIYYDSLLNNHLAHFNLFYDKKIKKTDTLHATKNHFFSSRFKAEAIINGSNKNDLKTEWINSLILNADENKRLIKKSNTLLLKFLYENRSPDFIYNYTYANNFKWNNQFKQQSLFQTKLSFKNNFSGFGFYALLQNTNNFLYFDSLSAPAQLSKPITNIALNINYAKLLFKHIGIKLNATYQTTSAANELRIPPYFVTGSLYYYGNLFKNNLQLQIGSQVEYYPEFNGYAYMPATNIFYTRQQLTVGNYPFLDVFLNARIKPVQFFVKLENVLHGFVPANYYFVRGYAQPDRAIRFGLTWLFFD